MFNFLKNRQTFPKLAVLFCIHTISEWVCLLSSILVSTWYCQFEKTIHLNMGVVVSHCIFNVISLITNDVEHLLHICWPLLFGELFYSNLLPIFILDYLPFGWVLRVLYVFWILDTYQICHLQILSPIL